MLKKSSGNMYPWVTHTKSYLRGACPHACTYCYVQAMAKGFPNVRSRYSGALALDDEELAEPLGENRTIFIEHMNDLFAGAVPQDWIKRVLYHCAAYKNRYVFQTKNPERLLHFYDRMFPDTVIGTTLESNRHYPDIMRNAPHPKLRYGSMLQLPRVFKIFVTIEPILDFDPLELTRWLAALRPDWVNVGADSKGRGLPEPTPEKLKAFLTGLDLAGIIVQRKTNLERLLSNRKSPART